MLPCPEGTSYISKLHNGLFLRRGWLLAVVNLTIITLYLTLLLYKLFRVGTLWSELVSVLYSDRCALFTGRVCGWYPLQTHIIHDTHHA